MLSSAQTFRFIGILCALTILNMTFLGVSWNKRENTPACSVDNVLEGLSRYIKGSGARKLGDVMAQPCIKSINSEQTLEAVVSSVRGLVSICKQRSENRKLNKAIRNPVITLFTTWANTNDTEKVEIHTRTLKNWASLKPSVEVVVFTNSSEDAELAEKYGAEVLPILHHKGGGAPVLRSMFETVKKDHIFSTLYGYVNSDILFTDSFIETLQAIIRNKDMNNPVFIVGRRINVKNITSNETETYAGIEKIAKNRGTLFGANAEDFFITNAAFPWSKIVDVVVGRLAYDNWIVGHVICNMKIDVIEITETVTSVHQTSKAGGNYEGFKSKHANYNNVLFKAKGMHPKFESGFTICAPEYTFRNLCGDIQILKRKKFWHECACPRPKNASVAVLKAG